MGFTYGTYTWNSLGSADESNWTFTDPVGTGVQTENTARRWCWTDTDTVSVDIGPTSGQGGNPDGYLYTEASSPGDINDTFTMELNDFLKIGEVSERFTRADFEKLFSELAQPAYSAFKRQLCRVVEGGIRKRLKPLAGTKPALLQCGWINVLLFLFLQRIAHRGDASMWQENAP